MILTPDQRAAWRKRILAEMHTMWRVAWIHDGLLQREDYPTEDQALARLDQLAAELRIHRIHYRVSGYEHQEAS